MKTNKQKENWKKIVYRETNDVVRCIQGVTQDLGDFLEVIGDYKEICINKKDIVSITTSKRAGNNNDKE